MTLVSKSGHKAVGGCHERKTNFRVAVVGRGQRYDTKGCVEIPISGR